MHWSPFEGASLTIEVLLPYYIVECRIINMMNKKEMQLIKYFD